MVHPIIKIIVGAILMVGSVAVIYQYTLPDFLIAVKGVIPPLVFILGLFVVWLELDELRIEREIKAEEKKKKQEEAKPAQPAQA